ncbi:MAG: SprB repeat-containing protein [Flavobacteriales bacterium]|jgi:uncharacterized repeat protein (TIGR01451 family)|nr:SprB repeat-containing protein [Flavobacteriales bacterium]
MRSSITAFLFFAAVVHAQAITITLMSWSNPACSTPDGFINIGVSGGTPPYTYAWSNGAITQNIAGLGAGYYEVTVTDAASDQATQGWNLNPNPLTSAPSAQDGHASCIASMNGRVQVIEWGINGTPPYSYSPPPNGIDPQGDPYFELFGVAPGQAVQIQVTDAMGCTGVLTEYVMAPQIYGGPQMTVGSVQGSCSTGAGGSAVVGNIYDGSFFGGPDYQLLDATDAYIAGGFNAANTITFTGLAPGDYHMVRDWDPNEIYMAYSCDGNPYDRIDFTIPDLGPDCGSVSGTAYIDYDGDCVQDPVDYPVPYQVLEILPGPGYTITNASGSFSMDLVDGNYTIEQTDPTLVQNCPASAPVPFTIASNQITIALANSSTVPLDASAELSSSAMRPGFIGSYWGAARNLSPQLTGAVTITLSLDPQLSFANAWPVPLSVNGSVVTWELPALAPLSSFSFSVQVLVLAPTPIGTPLSTSADVTCAIAEGGLANNTATVAQLVTGSYDPNDKLAATSSGWSDELYYIDQDEWIDYTIRFQNTGTDTAFTVVITDTLAAELDMASFQQRVASHAFEVAFKPGRVVEWTFADILLPDSNVNEPASHGSVQFRIRPAQPLLAGTVIENIANIYFDFNDPVITEPSMLTAEFSTGVTQANDGALQLAPVPVSDQLRVAANRTIDAVQIIGMDGREELRIPAQASSASLHVGSLASGAYLLIAYMADGTILRSRFKKL